MQNRELKSIVSRKRKDILTLIEVAFGDSPRWPSVRTQLLNLLGDRGLENELLNYLKKSKRH